MCGRFVSIFSAELMEKLYGIDAPGEFKPCYNVAPGRRVLLVRSNPVTGKREPVVMEWGLIPFWAGERNAGRRLINARGESILVKPAFREAFRRRRALVPASGFYEWKKEGSVRQPYFIARRDGRPFSFAGLWERRGQEEDLLATFAIITTAANPLVAAIHDRMPVIIPEKDYALWLDRTAEPDCLAALLSPYPAEEMSARPVSRLVNSPRHDGPHLLEAITDGR